MSARLSLAQAKPFKCRVTGKAGKLYDECHLMWRAGLIEDWYYGRRSPSDPTIVWELNGLESTPEQVATSLAARRASLGVESVEWGETWIGYRAVVVTYSDGQVATERYNAATASVEIVRAS